MGPDQKMLEQWKLIAEANYEGSLDMLCYFYRREIERSCNNEVLLEVKIFEYCSCSAPSISLYHICSLTSICQLLFSQACKRAWHFVKHPGTQPCHPATEPISPAFTPYHSDCKYVLFQPHLSLKVSNDMPHKDAFECLSAQFTKGAPKTNRDREKIFRVWAEFVVPFFYLPVHWFLNELQRDRTRSHKSSCIVNCEYFMLA